VDATPTADGLELEWSVAGTPYVYAWILLAVAAAVTLFIPTVALLRGMSGTEALLQWLVIMLLTQSPLGLAFLGGTHALRHWRCRVVLSAHQLSLASGAHRIKEDSQRLTMRLSEVDNVVVEHPTRKMWKHQVRVSGERELLIPMQSADTAEWLMRQINAMIEAQGDKEIPATLDRLRRATAARASATE